MFYLNGSGQTFVFDLGDELKQVAVNRVTLTRNCSVERPQSVTDDSSFAVPSMFTASRTRAKSLQPSENAIAETEARRRRSDVGVPGEAKAAIAGLIR